MGGNRRYPDRWNLPPITLADVYAGQVPVTASCPICRVNERMSPEMLDGEPEESLADIGRRMICRCGREGLGLHPDSRSWIHYLRRTGQRAREPWNAGFVPWTEEDGPDPA